MSSASRSARARRSWARATALRRAASHASSAPQSAAKVASIPAPNAAPCRKTCQIDVDGTESGTATEAACKVESTGCGSSPSLQSAPGITPGPGDACLRTLVPSQFVDAALTPVVYRIVRFFQISPRDAGYYGQSGILRAYGVTVWTVTARGYDARQQGHAERTSAGGRKPHARHRCRVHRDADRQGSGLWPSAGGRGLPVRGAR